MNFEIKLAEKKDMGGVLSLIKELAKFEREPNAVIINEKDLMIHGFSNPPLFLCHIAKIETKIVGMSLGYSRYSTWKGPTMHLEDLIVTKKYRNLGIGKALFKNFIFNSHSKGVRRIEWAVLNWNKNAIDFYVANGAKIYNDWQIAQMDENAIINFVKLNNENI